MSNCLCCLDTLLLLLLSSLTFHSNEVFVWCFVSFFLAWLASYFVLLSLLHRIASLGMRWFLPSSSLSSRSSLFFLFCLVNQNHWPHRCIRGVEQLKTVNHEERTTQAHRFNISCVRSDLWWASEHTHLQLALQMNTKFVLCLVYTSEYAVLWYVYFAKLSDRGKSML